jgi:CheY-like chemotaxis protein
VKVLIVEDYEVTRSLIVMMARMRGCQTLEAADGLEAVEAATRELPDLILMDLNLPALDGWEATRRIVTRPETRHIPVVAVSAHCKNDWREKALAAGARDCLQKPIDPTTLDVVLRRYATGC